MTSVDEATPGQELEQLVDALERSQATIAGLEESQRRAAEGYGAAIEALHREAFRRVIRALRADPAALAAMKRAAGDALVYSVLRRLELVKPSLDERVHEALASVRPMLAAHGGDVALRRLAPPVVEVEMTGACDGCSAAGLTFQAGIRKALKEACPELTEVVLANARPAARGDRPMVSPFARAGGGWVRACELRDLPDGRLRNIELDGESFVLHRRDRSVVCYLDVCAHLGRPIHDGHVEDGVLQCRHHGFRYDLATGACLDAPSIRLQAQAVRIVDDRVEIRLPT